MDREQNFFSGPIGVVQHERPTELPCNFLKIEAMALDPLLIFLPEVLRTAGDHRRPAFGGLKLGTPLVWQRLLGRIENLNQMTANALACVLVEAFDDFVDGLEKIGKKDAL